MTTPTHVPSPPVTPARGDLRLRMEPHLGRGALDGSWWPRSRDLDLEVADLLDHFPPELGRVRRVVFSPTDWDTAPRRVKVARGWVKVGSYPRDDTHQVWLAMFTGQVIRLGVTSFDDVAPDPPVAAVPIVAAEPS